VTEPGASASQLAAAARPAVAPAPRTGAVKSARAPARGPKTGCRRHPLVCRPSRYPCGQTGNDPPWRTKHASTDRKHAYPCRFGASDSCAERAGSRAQIVVLCTVAPRPYGGRTVRSQGHAWPRTTSLFVAPGSW